MSKAKATARTTTSLAVINWLRDNPQPLSAICAEFGLSYEDFRVLRYSQEWRDAEATTNLVVARPVRQMVVDADGDIRWTYLYEATARVAEGHTMQGLLATMRDAATRLDNMMARNTIVEHNETSPHTQALLSFMNGSNLAMVAELQRNVETMERVQDLVEAERAAAPSPTV